MIVLSKMDVSNHPFMDDVINCKQFSLSADILPDLFCLSDSDLYCLYGEPNCLSQYNSPPNFHMHIHSCGTDIEIHYIILWRPSVLTYSSSGSTTVYLL